MNPNDPNVSLLERAAEGMQEASGQSAAGEAMGLGRLIEQQS